MYYFRKAAFTILVILSFSFIVFSKSIAMPIVDTGTPTTLIGLPGVAPLQSLAGQFTISDKYNISSAEGFFLSVATTVKATIYADTGGIPGSGALFSQVFDVDTTGTYTFPPNGGATHDWYGATGLNWTIDPGTYWIAFDWVSGADTGMTSGGAPSPMDHYAWYNGGGSPPSWLHNDANSIAVRIQGNAVNPIPEPSTYLLLGIGLAGITLMRKKFLRSFMKRCRTIIC